MSEEWWKALDKAMCNTNIHPMVRLRMCNAYVKEYKLDKVDLHTELCGKVIAVLATPSRPRSAAAASLIQTEVKKLMQLNQITSVENILHVLQSRKVLQWKDESDLDAKDIQTALDALCKDGVVRKIDCPLYCLKSPSDSPEPAQKKDQKDDKQ